MERILAEGLLAGRRVLTFETRRKKELKRLLARHGAEVICAPALREVPLEKNPAALELLDRLRAGTIDGMIFLTGVGTRALVEAVQVNGSKEEFIDLLRGVKRIVRGPKPVAALRELGLQADVCAPSPNTWRELLAVLDAELPVQGLRLGVQEYGRSNSRFLASLVTRGASVLPVPVYRWCLPEDTGPLKTAIKEVLDGKIDIVAFTTSIHLEHLLGVAGDRTERLLEALRTGVTIASIGPSVGEALEAYGLRADIVPTKPNLGTFAAAIANEAPKRKENL